MHTTRMAFTAAAAAALVVVAVVACSDSRTPATPVDPGSASDVVVAAPRRAADVRANEDPNTFRRIPEAHRWVGEEHNRLLDIARRQAAHTRASDPAAYRRMKGDCAWAFAVMRDNLDESAVRGGFAARKADVLRLGKEGVMRLPGCGASAASMALFAAPSFGVTPMQDDEEMSLETEAALNTLVAELYAAGSPADIDASIAHAAAAASTLPAGQSDAVYAAASLAAGSASYWSYADASGGGQELMSLFSARGSDWDRFKGAVGADAAGCAGFLTLFGKWPLPWQVKIAGCLLVGATSSVMYAF